MKKSIQCGLLLTLTFILVGSAQAGITSGPDIISAPMSVADDFPGAENTRQQAFDERQNVLLPDALMVDGGSIAADTTVSSHMIFLNTRDEGNTHDTQTWTFDGEILGVMSDVGGTLEAASNDILGNVGTFYPGAFSLRGLESGDTYNVAGSSITVSLSVAEPGDWMRVVTKGTSSPVPVPGALLLGGFGTSLVSWLRRRRTV